MPRLPLPESLKSLPTWVTASFRRKENLEIDYNVHAFDEDGTMIDKRTGKPVLDEDKPVESDAYNANLISSRFDSKHHVPILDIDVPVHVVPSSTPGHNHIYILHLLDDADMTKLIDTLVEVGIMQPGIKKMQWEPHRELTVRPPWVKKGDNRSWLEQHENRLTNGEKKDLEVMRGMLASHKKSLDAGEYEENNDPNLLTFLPEKSYLEHCIADLEEKIAKLESREA